MGLGIELAIPSSGNEPSLQIEQSPHFLYVKEKLDGFIARTCLSNVEMLERAKSYMSSDEYR